MTHYYKIGAPVSCSLYCQKFELEKLLLKGDFGLIRVFSKSTLGYIMIIVIIINLTSTKNSSLHCHKSEILKLNLTN